MDSFDLLFSASEKLTVHNFFKVITLNKWSLLTFIEYVDDNTEPTRSEFYNNLAILFDAPERLVPAHVKPRIGYLIQDNPNNQGVQYSRTNEPWLLTKLALYDLAFGDYESALNLSRRLFSMNMNNPDYRYLYARSLYKCEQYEDSKTIIQYSRFVPSLYLFAEVCLVLSYEEDSKSRERTLLQHGIDALSLALCCQEFPQRKRLTRFFSIMPSKTAIYKSLFNHCLQLRDTDQAAKYYEEIIMREPSLRL